MSKSNYEQMFAIIEQVFSTRNDPNQIQVSPQQLKKLQAIHPATLTELADENGPLIWILVIPTTNKIMQEFLEGKISEKKMLDKTKVGAAYDCIYLCSATTLPQMRGKGESKKLAIQSIKVICKSHPIKTLFVWPFTKAGLGLAKAIASECKLQLKVFQEIVKS